MGYNCSNFYWKSIIGGHLNDHIEREDSEFKGIYEGFGYEERNKEGGTILDFATLMISLLLMLQEKWWISDYL